MPQDPNLYGQPAAKKRKQNTALSSSLDFTSQLSSLLSSSSAATSTGSRPARSRTTKLKDDIFRGKTKSGPSEDKAQKTKGNKLVLKDAPAEAETEESLARARKKMEEKARIYASMKRGDYVQKDNETGPLVDFDRKWAEADDQRREGRAADASSGSSSNEGDSEDDDDDKTKEDEEIVEYEDEFGRLRRGTKSEIASLERRRRRGILGAEELERMSARPAAPANIIYGDAVQTLAFTPDDPEKMEAIARKRDRSATPPEQKHYDADSEVRTKGAGFYKFSKDEEARQAEMRSLDEERRRTEEKRQEQQDKKLARKKEIEERRKALEARRASKMADSFLDGLAADMEGRS